MVDGREAERLLKDPTFQKACDRLERKYLEKWRIANNTAEREACHALVKGLDNIKSKPMSR